MALETTFAVLICEVALDEQLTDVHQVQIAFCAHVIRITAQLTLHEHELVTDNVEHSPGRVVSIGPHNGKPLEQITDTEFDRTIPFIHQLPRSGEIVRPTIVRHDRPPMVIDYL